MIEQDKPEHSDSKRLYTDEGATQGPQVAENIYWVGAIDWSIRDFHSYETRRGTSYNAYLIKDQKNALIDSVKSSYTDPHLEEIQKYIDIRDLDYIVCNHAELDHSGAIPKIMERSPQTTIICNDKCRKALSQHFSVQGWRFKVVDENDTVSLGKHTLTFINTPLVHWPESMFTYVPEEKLLFSMDAFGQHMASSQRFDDHIELAIAVKEAKTYYANIVMMYGKQVEKVFEQAGSLELKTIAPSHGIIWRKHKDVILSAYQNWMHQTPAAKILIVFDSMWGSTERMAEAICEGASRYNVSVVLKHVRKNDFMDMGSEFLDTAAIVIGTPTLNKMMMPQAAAALAYFEGLDPVQKIGLAFGSYGWSKGGPKRAHTWLESMKVQMIREPIEAQFVPTPEILEECKMAGKMLAERVLEIVERFDPLKRDMVNV